MNHVALGLGSNIAREKNIRFALAEITRRFGAPEVSPVYETTAVGFVGPPFYNLVAGFHSTASLDAIRDQLRQVEAGAGRVHGPKTHRSRTLDIDILLYGAHDLRSRGENIPRDEIERCAYVLKPLADLYPDRVHPVRGRTMRQLWQDFAEKDQNWAKVEFPSPPAQQEI